jgi:predicted DNA-binding antitoxin AbrB/MazE fold protein
MSFTAKVQGGVIVLPENVHLADGTEVKVEAIVEREKIRQALDEVTGILGGKGERTDDLIEELRGR